MKPFQDGRNGSCYGMAAVTALVAHLLSILNKQDCFKKSKIHFIPKNNNTTTEQ